MNTRHDFRGFAVSVRVILSVVFVVTLAAGSKVPQGSVKSSNEQVAVISPVAYVCDNGMKVLAEYDNPDTGQSSVRLKIGNSSYVLTQAISASGARYTAMSGMSPDKAIQWWTKGTSASLNEGSKDDDLLLEKSVPVAKCSEE